MTQKPLLVPFLLLLGCTAVANAGDRGPIDQDFQLSLGGFFMETDTRLRLDGETIQTGTEVEWESEFGLEDKDRFRIDGFWRFAEHHKLRMMYFENNRSGSETLTRDITYGDTTYTVGTTVEASLDSRIVELVYEYAFLKHENLELSGSFGVHSIELGASLRGDVTGPGGGTTEEVREGTVTGPLPVIGFHALWNMGNNFYFDGLAQFFYIQFDNYDGRLYDYKLTATWYPARNVGVGLGYNAFVTRLKVEKNDFTGRLRVGYGGAMAFFTVGF